MKSATAGELITYLSESISAGRISEGSQIVCQEVSGFLPIDPKPEFVNVIDDYEIKNAGSYGEVWLYLHTSLAKEVDCDE